MNQPYWWDIYGPFDPDEDEFPHAGQVIRHYRMLKGWTPTQLGEALNKSARWVQSMEHDNTVPEAISRRRAIAAILGIPPILLGLASIEASKSPPKSTNIDAAILDQYREILRLYWELDYTGTAQESMDDIERWIRHLRTIAPNAGSYQTQVIELLCRYHQLATWIARDQRDYTTALTHGNKAIKLATSLNNHELLAASLFRRGRTKLEQGDITGAITDLDAALPHAQHARAQLRGLVLLAAGHARAYGAQGSSDISYALSLIDQASRIVRRSNLEDDESFVKLSTGRYHLDRADALIVARKPSEGLDELDLAVKGINIEQTRRHAYANVLRAKAYTKQGEILLATATAETALEVAKDIQSAVNIARIAEIQTELSSSKYGNTPQLARLRHLLTSP